MLGRRPARSDLPDLTLPSPEADPNVGTRMLEAETQLVGSS